MTIERDEVLRACCRVLVRRPQAAMQELAEAAGISRASLHRVVPGREALEQQVRALALRESTEAVQRARLDEDDPESALQRLVAELAPVSEQFAYLAHIWTIVGTGDEPPGTSEHSNAQYSNAQYWEFIDAPIAELFERGQRAGLLRPDLTVEWLTEATGWLLMAAAVAAAEGRLARQHAGRSVLGLLLDGARARQQGGRA